MAINRRQFIALAGASATLSLANVVGATDPPRFLSSRYYPKRKQYVAVIADQNGQSLREVVLPDRCHDVIPRPRRFEAVAIARRPGNFAIVFDIKKAKPLFEFKSPSTRHFQGHAIFDSRGILLFTTENDFDQSRGVIGIYDATDSYRRLGELPSHGIGAHELAFLPDCRTLVVANGGIITHPDTGRTKLNIPTMRPSLSYVDAFSGELKARWMPMEARQCKLSIRHLGVRSDGVVAYACQDQGPKANILPLVGIHHQYWRNAVFLQASQASLEAMQGYLGSISWDTSGNLIAASAPRGDIITIWDAATQYLTDTIILPDACGVTAGAKPGSFVGSSGQGKFINWPRPSNFSGQDAIPWDNHISRISS